jgi:hypothetical protein
MKKTITLMAGTILLILLSGTQVNAQEQQTDTETGIVGKFGIKGGLNFSNMYIDDVGDEKMKLGWHAGFFGKFPLTRGVSLQPELLYSSKGTKLNYTAPLIGAGEYRFNLNYVELPVLLSFNIGENFHINVGPYAAYLAHADVTEIENDGTVDELLELDEEDFKRWDFGAAAGIGFDVNKFTIGARYTLGLTEINDATILSSIAPNSKNSAINVFIGFAF